VRMCNQTQLGHARRLLNLLLGLLVFPLCSASATQSVAFGWDPSADVNAVGYNIYFGTASHIYTNKVPVGNVTAAAVGGLLEGATYYFAATTYDTLNLESSFCDEIAYTIPYAPTNQPPAIIFLSGTNQADAGANPTFAVIATGTGPLAYQWLFNNNRLASATDTMLALTNISAAQAGEYVVIVTNAFGSATSAPVVLTVNVTTPPLNLPPTITSLLATNAAQLGQNLNFSVRALGTGALAYQWLFNGSNLVAATDSILALNNVTAAQSGIYRVVVINNFGTVTSAPVTLVITLATALLTPVAPVNGQFALSLVGQPGYQYLVQASTNLATWVAIATNISPFNLVDADTSRFQQRFYRSYLLGLPATNFVNDVTSGLIARYALAANGNDSQGGNHLTLAGFPNFSAGAVNWNGAVPTLGYSAPRQWPQAGVTVSAWINLTDPSANYIVAACYGDSSGQLSQAYLQFSTQNGGLNARIVQHIDTDYIGRVTPANLTAGWHFVALTWAGGTASSSIKIYLDGVAVDSADANRGTFTAAYAGADLPFTVGAQFSDGWGISGKFYGSQKGVRMYDHALAPAEINSLYYNGTSVGYF
jgi:hypothetical protein